METPASPFTPATESFLQQHGGPLSVSGQQGKYVVMTSDVYEAMLGLEAMKKPLCWPPSVVGSRTSKLVEPMI
jgi:hypothetical protein